MKLTNMLIGAALVLTPLDAVAAPAGQGGIDIYACNMELSSQSGFWIGSKYLFGVQTAGAVGQFTVPPQYVLVNDPVIQHFGRGPVQTRVDGVSGQTITFSWFVDARDRAGKTARIKYQATLFRGVNSVNIDAWVFQYQRTYMAKGTCTPQDPAGMDQSLPAFTIPWNYDF